MRTLTRVIGCLLVSSSPVAVLSQDKPKYEELPNFYQVNSKVYRGAQPKRGGIEKLAGLGIKTVINLRDNDERARIEGQDVKAAGMSYYNIPLARWGQPNEEQVKQIFELITAPQNQPVFVHCRRGADRTGTVMAVYRIEYDGWTSKQAKAEANRYGMAFWHRRMKRYIRSYYERRHKRTRDAYALPEKSQPQLGSIVLDRVK